MAWGIAGPTRSVRSQGRQGLVDRQSPMACLRDGEMKMIQGKSEGGLQTG